LILLSYLENAFWLFRSLPQAEDVFADGPEVGTLGILRVEFLQLLLNLGFGGQGV
jgi:hypothetical protein